jgi:rod shape-determining protein MreC
VYDRKTVRRRRAVLGLLVAGALILLTAYFGESSSGGLHSAQRGVFSIVAPVQDGASRALKPFRDFINWFGDTIDAKGEVADLRKQRDRYRVQQAQYASALNENKRLATLLSFDQSYGVSAYAPVTGRVIGSTPSAWSQRIALNVGTGDGVQRDMPVISGGGLVGLIKDSAPTGSYVNLITSGDLSVGVEVQKPETNGVVVRGVAKAAVGNPNDIVMTFTDNKKPVRVGDIVVTSGTVGSSTALGSPYPQGIPVGVVTSIENPGSDQQEIHLRPAANVRSLSEAQVLTKVDGA